MLTPEYLLHVSEGAEQISAQLHTDILKRITGRILARQRRRSDYVLTAVDKWQIEVLMDAGILREEIIKEIALATSMQEQEIQDAFEDAGVRAWDYDSKIYEAAGIPVTTLTASPYAIRLMQRNFEATLGEWENFTRTTADAAQQLFISKMDEIYNNVASGNLGYTQAFAEAIDDLASDGVRNIVYTRIANGVLSVHTDTIETATLRCVRTGISQMSAQIQTARMDEMGVDLVLVSSHMGARPTHQVWQGKIYSRSGNNRKYPDFVSSTGYGTGPGLCGWNCRHNFSPWFEGMENPFEDYDKEENLKVYNDTQKQRAMERGIRKTKRQAQVLEYGTQAAQNDETRAEIQEQLKSIRKKLAAQNKAYTTFCDDHDLRPLRERLRIAQANRRK